MVPELLPTFRLFYARTGRLFTISKEGRLLAVDSSGALYGSTEGCSQGDPLGPFYWAVGYYETLLETQARHPPAKGLAAMRTGDAICPQLCGVESSPISRSKGCMARQRLTSACCRQR